MCELVSWQIIILLWFKKCISETLYLLVCSLHNDKTLIWQQLVCRVYVLKLMNNFWYFCIQSIGSSTRNIPKATWKEYHCYKDKDAKIFGNATFKSVYVTLIHFHFLVNIVMQPLNTWRHTLFPHKPHMQYAAFIAGHCSLTKQIFCFILIIEHVCTLFKPCSEDWIINFLMCFLKQDMKWKVLYNLIIDVTTFTTYSMKESDTTNIIMYGFNTLNKLKLDEIRDRVGNQ